MADTFVDAGANTFWETGVIERARVRVALDALLVADTVELVGGDAWADVRCSDIKNLSSVLVGQLWILPDRCVWHDIRGTPSSWCQSPPWSGS